MSTQARSSVGGFGLDRIVAIVGGALMIIGAFLEWFGRNYQPLSGEDSFTGFDIPAGFVVDSEADLGDAGLSLGLLVVLIGIAAVVGGAVPRYRLAALVAGVLALVAVALYTFQLNDLTDRINEGVEEAQRRGQPSEFGPGGYGVRNTIGFGAILAGLGGVVAAVSAAVPYTQRWLAARPGPTPG